jgi:uncharacterized C2H2 Zn-finger protein
MANKIISCGYCGRIFDKEKDLEEHKEAIHYNEELNIKDM